MSSGFFGVPLEMLIHAGAQSGALQGGTPVGGAANQGTDLSALLQALQGSSPTKQVSTTGGFNYRNIPLQTPQQSQLSSSASNYLLQALQGPQAPQLTAGQGSPWIAKQMPAGTQVGTKGGVPVRSGMGSTQYLPNPNYVAPTYGEAPGQVGDVRGSLASLLAGEVPEGVTSQAGALSEALEAPQRRQFQEVTLPRVKEAYGGSGSYWGGARAKAETRAGESFEEQLAAQRAQVLMGQQQGATQNLLSAIGMLPGLSTYENPNYAAQMQALQYALPLSTAQLQQSVVQPYQNQLVNYL